MGILTKRQGEEDILVEYIFDIFSKYQQVILREQLLQIVEIFMDTAGTSISQDLQRCETLTKSEFI